MADKLNKTLLKTARKREQLYSEVQAGVIDEQRRNLKSQKEQNKITEFKTVNALFNSFNHKKPTKYRQLYYKTLSRNHILDLSDASPGSPITLLDNALRENIISDSKEPEFEERDLKQIDKHLRNMKKNRRGLNVTIVNLKTISSSNMGINTAASIVKFVLKKHMNEAYLFESQMVQSYSECDFLVKFWSPLVEKVFRNTSITPHWGDTTPNSLTALGINMKMDLRLVTASPNRQLSDNGYGEFSKLVSEQKFFKDKRKTVVASKALLNSIISKDPFINFQEVHIPYVIVMGFELHLYSLSLSQKKIYMTRKIKSVFFPTTLDNLPEAAQALVSGLLNLLEMSLTVKRLATKVTKRKSMDDFLNSSSNINSSNDCLTKVLWDEVDMENELSVDDDSDDDSDNKEYFGLV
ncbi:hypothetical protein BDF14DRAFT_1983690 [Spinellus fusiger]|nr:hypothetical protein BDF14DRAFT_1983690 [Spinellus fusiger]